jgi:hypothetical protein
MLLCVTKTAPEDDNSIAVIDARSDVTASTVVAVLSASSLLGFARISQVLKMIEANVSGRLVVFFPGQFDRNNYRLLDARDGWNYLAVPITLHGEGGNE